MSRMPDIDNIDESLFDSFEPFEPPSLLEESARELTVTPPIITRGRHDTAPPLYYQGPSSERTTTMSRVDPKGKAVSHADPGLSEPMSIPGNVRPDVDLFSMSFESAGSSSSRRFARTPSYESQPSPVGVFLDADGVVEIPSDERNASPIVGKGKGRELPPTLPPLDFSSTEFAYGGSEPWPSTAGPSSYGSGYTSLGGEGSPTTPSPFTQISAASSAPNTPDTTASPVPIISRRRTTSNVSKQSRRSISAPSLPKVKVKFAAGSKVSSGTFARKLLFRKSPPTSPRPSSTDFTAGVTDGTPVAPDLSDLGYVGQGSCLIPWSRDIRSRSPLATPIVETNSVWGTLDSQPIARVPRLGDPLTLRTKGRSYSSPLPLQTVFDIVPLAPADIFQPPPPEVKPDYLDNLPHELKLHILVALVHLHEADHEKRVRNEKWTAIKASSHKNKWVGRDKGIRELFKLNRVSRSWQQLVFDGQLWSQLDLRSFPKIPPNVLMRLAETAGGFVRSFNLEGHAELCQDVFTDIAHHLCAHPSLTDGMKQTYLTEVNLHGCSSLTTRALHYLLIRSPHLQRLCLKGQTAVIDTTCDMLAVYCPRLVYLDLSRCPNLSGEGINSVASKAVERGEHMLLKDLRLGGLRRVTDAMMAALGRAAPYLEVLDLGYCKDLHNSSLEAFVACNEEDSAQFETVQLTSREAGRDTSDNRRYWRRVTRLRHLILSSCILLTDHACSHLAYTVPRLEFLELAGIGSELRDDGLVRLLNTTPYIRKLDLEDATEVMDEVLEALTPPTPTSTAPARSPAATPEPVPGHALEHLILSYANVESETLAGLIRACPRLRVLEADNTRMTGLVLREFVQRARERQMRDAKIVAVDCRAVGEHAVRAVAELSRPRVGWRSWHARKLGYLDARDGEDLGVGQDECDPMRVAVKTFYSWQMVDQVKAARDKKRKSGTRRGANASGNSHASEDVGTSSSPRTRWWSPSGRQSIPATPTFDLDNRGDGCIVM